MMVRISRSTLEQIMSLAAASGQEVCGLLLGQPGHVSDILPAENVAPDPHRYFELSPATLLKAHKAARAGGPAILGHYHSHPSGAAIPSATDAASARPDGSLWLIVGDDEARLWIAGRGEGGEVTFTRAMLDIM
ncbi:M67 family metallopeptidase [Sphingobium agri]|uniref:M67 family metallopeptidase n=1 Tax=Sphingobium agri TaxID=2933566 RepID=A0ABT0DW20_9SPHN|nr:M67 family metallopeptidase [Sphingobium agri]MCK0531307.1 M67 family metallopeptidase [Sphingobium agri]